MHRITPQDGDAIIGQAKWPRPYSDETLREINYAAYTSECADGCDDEPRPWLRRVDLAYAVVLIVASWVLTIALGVAIGAAL